MVTSRCIGLLGLLAVASCANREAQAPTLKRYQWPESFAYYVEYVAEAQREAWQVGRLPRQQVDPEDRPTAQVAERFVEDIAPLDEQGSQDLLARGRAG